MTLPAIPAASTLTTPQQITELATMLVAWAETVDDIAQVREASAKLAAITEYVRRTSREGVAEAEAALRRLEIRVGELLGPSTAGRPTSEMSVTTEITSDARHDFRQMAANPDIVEQVIAESTDADPPSRRKVLQAITERRPSRLKTVEERKADERRDALALLVRIINLAGSNIAFADVWADHLGVLNPDLLDRLDTAIDILTHLSKRAHQ